MARLFALADLHLSLAGTKPMDIFGELWRDHASRMADAWDERVADEDAVLLPGDISWARNEEEAVPDMGWIARRPGRKLLLRGNHDSWWSSATKVRRLLPPRCEPLHNDSIKLGNWVVVGARGWTSPQDPIATPGDERVYRRELERLRLSIAHADKTFGSESPRLAMVHYPPRIAGRAPGEVVELLERGAVRHCVYGHLHGDDHRLAVHGDLDGIRYHFAAADAVDFAPLELALDPPITGDGA